MSIAAVLVILVVTGEAESPVITATSDAATEVVGAAGSVRVVEVAALSDAAALRTEAQTQARAVAQLTWRDAAHLHASVRLHAARTDRWLDRNIDFALGDTPFERGRALGFTLASMLPESDPSLRFETPAAPEPPPDAPPAPLGSKAVGLAATETAGLGGPASGTGGVATIETFFGEALSADVSLAARLGRIAELDARDLTTSVGAGGAWWPLPARPTRAVGIAVRVEALLLYHAVAHARSGGATTWKGHLLPGADLKLEGTYRLGHALELIVGGGAEIAFGTIDVTVVATTPAGGQATIPALRAFAEAGLRVRF